MTSAPSAFLLSYFHNESLEDGEQVRFAVSAGEASTQWTPLAGGRPILTSGLGEKGVRDPFLIRDEGRDRFVVIATDLRIWPSGDWDRAVRYGSRSIIVWESPDLVTWSEPWSVEIAPPGAGNTWAPKAFWSAERDCWLVFWASAVFGAEEDRSAGEYQRMLVATTTDFRSFGPPTVSQDLGHDVIDATYLEHGGRWFRFSANSHGTGAGGNHDIFVEQGDGLEDAAYRPVTRDVARGVLERGEGPAVAHSLDGSRVNLLIDEFGLRGYQLFSTTDPASGEWHHVADAALPTGARHGSLLPITAAERERLLLAHPS